MENGECNSVRVLDKVVCNRSVFTFAEIKRSHHLVHVVAALFPIENSADNKWTKIERSAVCVCDDFITCDSPKINSLIFGADIHIE